MWRVIFSTYKKNRIGIIRAVPWSFMVSRIVTGITQIVFPYFIYYYFMNGNMNKEFGAYAEGADYMTYVVLGSALNVLAVSVGIMILVTVFLTRKAEAKNRKTGEIQFY